MNNLTPKQKFFLKMAKKYDGWVADNTTLDEEGDYADHINMVQKGRLSDKELLFFIKNSNCRHFSVFFGDNFMIPYYGINYSLSNSKEKLKLFVCTTGFYFKEKNGNIRHQDKSEFLRDINEIINSDYIPTDFKKSVLFNLGLFG